MKDQGAFGATKSSPTLTISLSISSSFSTNLVLHICYTLFSFFIFTCHVLFIHVVHTAPSHSILFVFTFSRYPFSSLLLFSAFSHPFHSCPSAYNYSFLCFLPCFPLLSVYMTHFLGPGPINHSVVGLACLPHCLAALPHHIR